MQTIFRRSWRERSQITPWLILPLSISACVGDEFAAETALAVAGASAPAQQPSTNSASGPTLGSALPTGATVPPSAGGAALATTMLAAVDAHGVKGALVAQAVLSAAGDGRSHLIEVDWEIPSGTEQYLCARTIVTDDICISAHYPLNPPGTHHTALTVLEKPNAPDGVSECDLSVVGPQTLGGSASGTPGGPLPAGVAMKFARGSQILLNLHLLNANEQPITGRSGAQVVTTQADAVKTLADGLAAGPIKLTIPRGRSVQTGVCTVDHDYTVFSVLPHMHQTGVHMKVVAHHAGADVLLHDGPFDFYDQLAYQVTPLALNKGDSITLECTYENTTAEVLHFGESSHDEMCIAGLTRYPAGGASACAH